MRIAKHKESRIASYIEKCLIENSEVYYNKIETILGYKKKKLISLVGDYEVLSDGTRDRIFFSLYIKDKKASSFEFELHKGEVSYIK